MALSRRRRRRGAGLELFREACVEGGDRDIDADGVVGGEFPVEIDVAGDEVVLGDDGDGVAEFREDSDAAAGEFELALDGLVAIGDAAEGDGFGLPLWRGEFLAQQFGGACLDDDFRLEIEAGGEAEVLVRGAGEAIGAAMLAARGRD